ncbi:MAG TPA: presqualene diphosphate synthase HpnD [Methylomirabilota bacterium]|nr:presqualene diphosphate synthase HpnD [Methylomirabilota bacterium]
MSQPATIDTSQLTAAHDVVEDVVVKARTSFYWAMRLLPAEKRQAMFAVYAFCRVVDDIADGELPGLVKLRQLQEWREEIDRLYAGAARHPIARALAEPMRRFDLAREDFLAIIDGMETDARGGLVAPTMPELELYCSRVAGAVGLLSVRIFGAPREAGRQLARALGEAVQLTNVLRDVVEDAGLGRLYLPRELLEKHGVPAGPPDAALRHPDLPKVCADLAVTAEARFAEAAELLRGMRRRPLKAARVILVVYRRLLQRLQAEGFTCSGAPVKLSKAEKLWLVLRHGIV